MFSLRHSFGPSSVISRWCSQPVAVVGPGGDLVDPAPQGDDAVVVQRLR